MLPTICAFLLSVSSFGSDGIETRFAVLQNRVCELFAEQDIVSTDEEVSEVEEPVVEVTETEVVETEVVADVVETNLSPEVMPETEMIEPATAAPVFEIVEEEEEVAEATSEEIVEEEIDGHVAEVVVQEVEGVQLAGETEMTEVSDLEELLGAWPQLSEETRMSILLLIRIDNSVE